MKKNIFMIFVILTSAVLILLLVSCGDSNNLKGKYIAIDEQYGIESFYEFSGENITFNIHGLPGVGIYKIMDDKIIITANFSGTARAETYSFEKVSDKVIIIDGLEFTKK